MRQLHRPPASTETLRTRVSLMRQPQCQCHRPAASAALPAHLDFDIQDEVGLADTAPALPIRLAGDAEDIVDVVVLLPSFLLDAPAAPPPNCTEMIALISCRAPAGCGFQTSWFWRLATFSNTTLCVRPPVFSARGKSGICHLHLFTTHPRCPRSHLTLGTQQWRIAGLTNDARSCSLDPR